MTAAEVLAGVAYAVPIGCALGVLVSVLASWGRA